MKNLFHKSLAAFFLISFCSQFVFPQDLRKDAAESPLAAAFYLLSTTGKDAKQREKSCLASSLARAEKFSSLERAADLVEPGGYVVEDFISLAEDLRRNGKIAEASNFVSYLLKKFSGDEYMLEKMLKILVRLGRGEEALKIAGQLEEDYQQTEAYFEIANVYIETGKREKAVNIIDGISSRVEKSDYDADKARLGLFYAKLGKEEQSLRFLQLSLKPVARTTAISEGEHERILDDVFAAYLLLGKYELAEAALEKRGKSQNAASRIQIALSYFARGDRKKALELLERAEKLLNPGEYGASFDLGTLIEIYLHLGEIEKAVVIAKNLTGSEFIRQKQLLNIADFYIKKRNKKAAYEILNFALEQTGKIKTDEAESGSLWTSGKWNQARYQSQIALRLIAGEFDKPALELILQIRKPYLQALLLTEFVNKNRKSSENPEWYLEKALFLLRGGQAEIFDANKYDVYATVARKFAEIGMSEKANEVFAEVLSKDKEMVEKGLDGYLLVALCKIGVEFEKSRVKPNEKLRASLRNIIENWENEEY